MEVKLNQINPTSAQLTIQVTPEDYDSQVNAKLKSYAKTANIKGFRPGKVPTAIIKNMMGENILAEEVFTVISKELNSYIKENNLSIIGDPLPAETEKNKQVDWKNDKNFEFTYDLGTVPEFDLAYDKVKVEKYAVDIDDKTVDETISNILKQTAETVDAEEVSEEDYVTGSLKQVDGDIENTNSMIPTNKMAKTEGKKLIGKKIGDVVTFDLSKLFKGDATSISHVAGISKEEAAEVSGDFEFTITKISHKQDPEMNEEFFSKVLPGEEIKTEEEFKAKLKEKIGENFNKDAEFVLGKHIREKLVDAIKVDYSEDFFKRWILESNKDSISAEELDERFDQYVKELKWSFIRNKIAEENELKAEEADIRAKAEEIVRHQYLGGMEIQAELREQFNAFVDNFLKENKGRNYYNTFDQVLSEKVISFLQEKVSVTNKKIGSEKFKEVVEAETKQA